MLLIKSSKQSARGGGARRVAGGSRRCRRIGEEREKAYLPEMAGSPRPNLKGSFCNAVSEILD